MKFQLSLLFVCGFVLAISMAADNQATAGENVGEKRDKRGLYPFGYAAAYPYAAPYATYPYAAYAPAAYTAYGALPATPFAYSGLASPYVAAPFAYYGR